MGKAQNKGKTGRQVPSDQAPKLPASSNWQQLKRVLQPAAVVADALTKKSRPLKRKRAGSDASSAVESLTAPSPRKREASVESAAGTANGHKVNKKMVPIEGIMGDDQQAWQREVGQYLAMDCEMVGVGPEGVESTLARVSVVNYHGATMLDRFVRPREKVTDYRTWVSGVREEDLRNAPTFAEVQKEVAALIEGRILVGHALSNDTTVLLLSHPWTMTRDTAKYPPLQGLARTKKPGLRTLAKLILDLDIQSGEHSSVTDARATMAIYRSQKTAWEDSLRTHSKPSLVTHTTPALAALDLTNISLTGVGRKNGGGGGGVAVVRPKTLGLAATLRHARSMAEQQDKDEHLAVFEAQDKDLRVLKKARKEEDGDLVVGFDFEPASTTTASKDHGSTLAGTGKGTGKGKSRGVNGAAADGQKQKSLLAGKGDRKIPKAAGPRGDLEKRPKSKEGWWKE